MVAALCRLWSRQGASVAPFKAQNMSNHSAVTADGGEVGRAQAMQAAAAGVDVERAMNPVLLKPSDGRSHVVVDGREVGTTDAAGWGDRSAELRPLVLDAVMSLRRRFDVVVAEGAGGAAEINLLDRDLVNLPLARAAGLPAVLVVDIDRGGAFAAAHGTVDLLPAELRESVQGVLFNRFRGDPSLLDSGISALEARHGIPVLGVLPHLGPEPLFGVEDSLDLTGSTGRARARDPLRVAAVRLPHLANPSDLDPLVAEPDVDLWWTSHPADLARADVVVVPGSRATVADLRWLRSRGLDDALAETPADVLGICAGAQLLGRCIHDDVESGVGAVPGLGLLPLETVFAEPKVVRRRSGTAGGEPVSGYQIHLGRIATDGAPWLHLTDEHGHDADGAVGAGGRILATSLHGVLDADGLRGSLLSRWAARHGREVTPSPVPFTDVLRRQQDRLADWLAADADVDVLAGLARSAALPGQEPGW